MIQSTDSSKSKYKFIKILVLTTNLSSCNIDKVLFVVLAKLLK